jgi:hypothetical protein
MVTRQAAAAIGVWGSGVGKGKVAAQAGITMGMMGEDGITKTKRIAC